MIAISEYLRKIFPVKYTLSPASENDMEFVFEYILKEANNGHFSRPFLISPDELYVFLKDIATKGLMSRIIERNGSVITETVGARLVIYGFKHNKIGFFIISEKYPHSSSSDIELYMAAIKESERRKGHFTKMLRLVLDAIPHNVKVFARCMEASTVMFDILVKAGFKHINSADNGNRDLELDMSTYIAYPER